MFAVKKFHYFIYGVHTIVRRDHSALTSLFKRANVSPRVLSWALELQRYDLEIEYVEGAANNVADALSRGTLSEHDMGIAKHAEEKVVALVRDSDWLQNNDQDFKLIIESIEARKEDDIPIRHHGRKLTSADFEISDGRLRLIRENGSRVNVIPRNKRRELFTEVHHGTMGGHFNARKMSSQLEKAAYWLGMKQDVAKWSQECQKCFVHNTHRVNTPSLKPVVVSRPFEIVGIDLLEMGLSSRGNRYIVTIIDHFTKYLGAYPVPDKRTGTVAEVLFSHWICGAGRWPETVLSDRGTEFENSVVSALCEIMGIKQQFTKGYCLRENGITERVNGTIVRMLKKS
uniref:RNA-directed DNA polymerase n=1 Tax=Haemonchus placei TaxID=6290 RepID=A0A0N4VSB0_HAEPC